MAVELCSSFIPPSEETAASEKLIRLFSSSPAEKEANKFKKVLSILGRSRTGHARFRRAPATGYTKIHSPTPIRQIPPPNFKPPLSSFKRKCASSETGVSGECSGCHCSKRRKLKVKRVVMVPAISMKMAEIPPDDYSWRKYGQKPIKGSPYPRGYYKCSSVRGCLARKHVERDVEDPTMLVVTYEGNHCHSISIDETPSTMILESS